MTIVLRVSGGVTSKIHDPFFIWKNAAGNYPILCCPDTVPGCSYLTQRSA